jgi:hypothetical protein
MFMLDAGFADKEVYLISFAFGRNLEEFLLVGENLNFWSTKRSSLCTRNASMPESKFPNLNLSDDELSNSCATD